MRDGNLSTQPDRFLFPPETTFRFYALVAALFGTLTFVWAWFYMNLPRTTGVLFPDLAECIRLALDLPISDADRQERARQCLDNFNRPQGRFVTACLAATAMAVLLLHSLSPFLVIARQRLRPLDEIADPDGLPPLREALDALVAQAGLRQPPLILVRSRAKAEAFTFGNWFRRYLSLDSGLISEFYTKRAAFDAKIRHELAHFRNGDISKVDLTTISWRLFITIVPLILLYTASLGKLSLVMLADLSWRFALIVGAVFLARNAVIRAREFDADARAFTWDGPHGALLDTLKKKARSDAALTSRWRRLPGISRMHPSPGERAAALENPGSLLRPSSLILPAVIGVAYGIGEPPGSYVLTLLTSKLGQEGLGRVICTSLFLLPLACWAGVAIWRDASGSLRRGLPDLFAPALGLAAAMGILVGFHLSFMATITTEQNPHIALPILILTLFFLWVRAGAYWWQSSEHGRRLVVPACWISLAIGYFVLVTMWSWLSTFDTSYQAALMVDGFTGNFGPLDLAWAYFGALIMSPVMLLFFVVLWGFLVLPRWLGLLPQERRRILRRRMVQVQSWTLVFAAILVAARLYVRQSVEVDLRNSEDFKIWFFYAWLWTGVLLQGSLAFLLTVRRPAATIGEASLCALLAGLLMGVATLAVNLAFGGGLGVAFIVDTLCQFAISGVLTAVPMATLGSSLRFVAAGFRPLPVAVTAESNRNRGAAHGPANSNP